MLEKMQMRDNTAIHSYYVAKQYQMVEFEGIFWQTSIGEQGGGVRGGSTPSENFFMTPL